MQPTQAVNPAGPIEYPTIALRGVVFEVRISWGVISYMLKNGVDILQRPPQDDAGDRWNALSLEASQYAGKTLTDADQERLKQISAEMVEAHKGMSEERRNWRHPLNPVETTEQVVAAAKVIAACLRTNRNVKDKAAELFGSDITEHTIMQEFASLADGLKSIGVVSLSLGKAAAEMQS